MNGLELARNLRSQGHSSTPIVMVSANADALRTPEAQNAVHDDFIVKPVKIDDLLERTERLLRLSWIFDEYLEEKTTIRIPIEQSDAEDLKYLISIGHIRGLHGKLDEIAAKPINRAAFVSAFRDRLYSFDLSGASKLLQEHCDDRL